MAQVPDPLDEVFFANVNVDEVYGLSTKGAILKRYVRACNGRHPLTEEIKKDIAMEIVRDTDRVWENYNIPRTGIKLAVGYITKLGEAYDEMKRVYPTASDISKAELLTVFERKCRMVFKIGTQNCHKAENVRPEHRDLLAQFKSENSTVAFDERRALELARQPHLQNRNFDGAAGEPANVEVEPADDVDDALELIPQPAAEANIQEEEHSLDEAAGGGNNTLGDNSNPMAVPSQAGAEVGIVSGVGTVTEGENETAGAVGGDGTTGGKAVATSSQAGAEVDIVSGVGTVTEGESETAGAVGGDGTPGEKAVATSSQAGAEVEIVNEVDLVPQGESENVGADGNTDTVNISVTSVASHVATSAQTTAEANQTSSILEVEDAINEAAGGEVQVAMCSTQVTEPQRNPPANPDPVQMKQQEALLHAIHSDHEEFRKRLLEVGWPGIETPDYDLLDAAISLRYKRVARVILEEGCRMTGERGTKAFHRIVSLGWTDLLELCLARGARISVMNSAGDTALHVGFFAMLPTKAMEQLAEKLVDETTIVLSNREGLSTLHLLCGPWSRGTLIDAVLSRCSLEAVNSQVLLTSRLYCRGYTALHFAVENNILQTAKKLLAHKADLYARNASQSTPIHLAAHLGHIEMLDLLLAHVKMYDDLQNDSGLTHFMCACIGTNVQVVREFLTTADSKSLTSAQEITEKRVTDGPYATYTPLLLAIKFEREESKTLLTRFLH